MTEHLKKLMEEKSKDYYFQNEKLCFQKGALAMYQELLPVIEVLEVVCERAKPIKEGYSVPLTIGILTVCEKALKKIRGE